jgi:hypothetical protein
MSYSPILLVHICAGSLGLLSGTAAMSFRKGSVRYESPYNSHPQVLIDAPIRPAPVHPFATSLGSAALSLSRYSPRRSARIHAVPAIAKVSANSLQFV